MGRSIPRQRAWDMFRGYLSYTWGWLRGGFVCSIASAGCWSAAREKRALLLLCGAIILGPILMSLQGVSIDSGAAARYLIFSLPLLLIFMAEGIDWLARHIRIRRRAMAAWGLTALIVVCWAPRIRAQFLAQNDGHTGGGRIAARANAERRCDSSRMEYRVRIFAVLRPSEDRIMPPDKYVTVRSPSSSMPLCQGASFMLRGRVFSDRRKVSVRRFERLEVTTYGGHTAQELLQRWLEDLFLRTQERVVAQELLEQWGETSLRRR